MEQSSPMTGSPNAGSEELYSLGNGGFLVTPTAPGKIFTREQLTEEQLEMGKTVKTFTDSKVMPKSKELEEKAHDADGTPLIVRLMREAGQLGLLAVDIPEEFGGLSMDLTTTMYVGESMGPSSGFGVTFMCHVGIGTLPILFFGTAEQKAKYLPKLASGEWMSSYGLTEPGSGSDALSGKTKADLDGDFYVLNGTKQFITNGSWADVGIVFARVKDQYSAFIVDLHTPGVTIGAEEKKMGIRGSSTTAWTFENVRVPKENLLGKIGDAAQIALNILNMGRLELGFAALGGAKYVLQKTLEYGKDRKQFGRPIVDFDMQMGRIADMAAGIFATDSILYRIAQAIDKKIAAIPKGPDYYENMIKAIRSFAMEASIAKVESSEMLTNLCIEAVKLHGGYGYVEEYFVERALRDSIINMIFEGTNDINRLVIFDSLVRNIYADGIPFASFMENVEYGLRKRTFAYPEQTKILADEKAKLYGAKQLAAYMVNEAIIRYGKEIKNNQQLMKNIADMIIPLYAADSTIARAHYLIEQGRKEASLAQKIAQLVTYQTTATVRNLTWDLSHEIYEGRERPRDAEKISWLCSLTMAGEKVNSFRLKREISRIVLEKGLK